MAHKKISVFLLCVFAFIAFCPAGEGILFAAQEETAADEEPIIYSRGALSAKEQAAVSRQNRFQYRQKDMLIESYIPGSEYMASSEDYEGQPLTEDERLYRYFGVATSLYQKGRYEESIEMLNYILEKDPRNDYVRNYLHKVIKANKSQEKQFRESSRGDANLLKRNEVKTLLEDGTAYFEHKNYDRALVKFYDVLELDPANAQAKRYMDKLKKHYSRQIRIEKMAKNEESAADEMSGAEDAESFMRKERSNILLDETELDQAVNDIIAQQRKEENRSNAMTLGPGDQMEIAVYDHPELSGKVVVGTGGHILLPLVNIPLYVKGLTPREANERITKAMGKYVKDPSVATTMLSYNKVFFVIDEVGCTPYPIHRPDFTLRDALFLADWGPNRALGRVIVVKADKIHPITKKVDAFDLIYRGNLRNNIKIEDGDVIYVPMTIAAKATMTIADTVRPFTAIRAARDEWWNLKWSQKGWSSIGKISEYGDEQYAPTNAGWSGGYYPGGGGTGGGVGGWGWGMNPWQW